MTVIVYTKTNCQPCLAVKRLLTGEGIAFEERDATEHVEYLQTIGARGAPVVVDGDIVIHGFDPANLRKLAQ